MSPIYHVLFSSLYFGLIGYSQTFFEETICIQRSYNGIVDGKYSWLYWNGTADGSVYSHPNGYILYPIKEENTKKYYWYIDTTEQVAYCEIEKPELNYVFNIEDCLYSWNIYDNNEWRRDSNMIAVNCGDVCVNSEIRAYGNGTYLWSHYNTSLNASVYFCNDCDPPGDEKGIWLIAWYYPSTSQYYWVFTMQQTNVGFLMCFVGVNLGPNYIFNLESCVGRWQIWNVTTQYWVIEDTATVLRCSDFPYHFTSLPTVQPTSIPITLSPTTHEPTTSMPTYQPITNIPTTLSPTIMTPSMNPTFIPTTVSPTTSIPTTTHPTTTQPTYNPVTSIPTTLNPSLNPSINPTLLPTTSTPTLVLTANHDTTENTNSEIITTETQTTKINNNSAESSANDGDSSWMTYVIIVLLFGIIFCFIIVVILFIKKRRKNKIEQVIIHIEKKPKISQIGLTTTHTNSNQTFIQQNIVQTSNHSNDMFDIEPGSNNVNIMHDDTPSTADHDTNHTITSTAGNNKDINEHQRILSLSSNDCISSMNDDIIVGDDEQKEVDDLKNWLQNTIKLPQYYDTFMLNGYESLGAISTMSKKDLFQIGISGVHQTKFMKHIKKLKGQFTAN